ncbi:MAG: hypothetical protein AAB617_00730 [Patescibacteria group bacterium]
MFWITSVFVAVPVMMLGFVILRLRSRLNAFAHEFAPQLVVDRRIAELWCVLDNSFSVQISLQQDGSSTASRERALATANATVARAKAAYMKACRIAEHEGYFVPVNHLQAESLARNFDLLKRGTVTA